jgi:hypothetical protein
METDGSQETVLVDAASGANGVAVAGGYVYWTSDQPSDGYIARCAVTGCANQPTLLSQFTQAAQIVVDAVNAYWADSLWGVTYCQIANCQAQTGVFGKEGAEAIAIAGTQLFWTDGDGLVTSGTDGQARSRIAMSPVGSCGQSSMPGIAVDASNVYWTYTCGVNGGVMKLPR